MFTIEKRLYAWELEQAYVLKKIILHALGVVALLAYWLLKFTLWIVIAVIAKPQLRKQIAPGEYETIESNHIGPRIQI